MKFDINAVDLIEVFSAEHVIISCIMDSGEEKFEPANIWFYTKKDQEMKGQIVGRNLAGNALAFNAIVPGNVPVVGDNKGLAVHFGKVPSLSYVNDDGLPIPTLWKFKFNYRAEFEAFFGLMLTFSKLGWAVNKVYELEGKKIPLIKGKENKKKQSRSPKSSGQGGDKEEIYF